MELQELVKKVLDSTIKDWTVITCWGLGSGPSYLNKFSVWNNGKGEFLNLEVDSHHNVASYKQDLSISMAWGITHNEDFFEEWANGFSDPKASSYFLDFFYNGVLVLREIYVCVDGGRCYLPLPDIKYNEAYKVERITVPKWKYDLLYLINKFTGEEDYDYYLKRAQIEVIEEGWTGK